MNPMKPMLGEIDAIQDQAALQKMIGRCRTSAITVPFGLGVAPTSTIRR